MAAPDTSATSPEIALDGPERLTGRIEIRDYDQDWPAAVRARGGAHPLGGGCGCPGGRTYWFDLGAGPRRQADHRHRAGRRGLRDEGDYAPGLTAAGYRLVLREPDWFEHRLFKILRRCREPACLLGRVLRDRSDVPVSRLAEPG